MNNFKVIKGNKEYDLKDLGVIVNQFNVHSPSPKHYREEIEGMDGFVDLGTYYGGRQIDTKLTIIPTTFHLARNELFRLFDSRQSFFIVSDQEPGKRWLVKYDSPFSIDRTGAIGEFDVSFVSHYAYSESIGTTLEPITFRYEHNINDLGLGLTENDYKHTSTTFSIYNAGDIPIDPREYGLKISYVGASTNLSIKNTTTNDEWTFTGTTVAGDEIVLNKIQSFKNDVSIFRDTNRKLITLDPGWNEFDLTGAEGSFEITFDFRFYYI